VPKNSVWFLEAVKKEIRLYRLSWPRMLPDLVVKRPSQDVEKHKDKRRTKERPPKGLHRGDRLTQVKSAEPTLPEKHQKVPRWGECGPFPAAEVFGRRSW